MSALLRRLDANPFAFAAERRVSGWLQLGAIAACYAFLAGVVLFL